MSQHQPPYSQNSPYGQDPQQPYGYGNPHQSGGGYPGQGMYSSSPPRRGGRGGKITFFIGLAVFVVGVAILIAGAVALFGTVSDLAGSGGTRFGESAQVEATAGTSYVILAQNATAATCDITSPSGSAVPMDTSASTTISDGSSETAVIGGFSATESGTYTLECSGASTFMYAEMDLGQLGLASLGLIAGIFLGFIGFVLGIIGLIVWLVGRQKVIY